MANKYPEWFSLFSSLSAYWKHSGKPSDPHVILTSGKHSDAYLNCTKIIQHPKVLDQVATALAGKTPALPVPDWVFGSPFGSITLAERLAHHFAHPHGNCRAGFTEPDGERFKVSRFELDPQASVLVADDVLTTGGTTEKTIDAIVLAGGTVLNRIVVIANRSGLPTFNGRQIISLIDLPLVKWEPDNCPLCHQGSKAIKAKGNWAQLTAKT